MTADRPPGELSLREARATDLDAIWALEAGAFTTPWTYSQLAAELNHPRALAIVALTQGRVIGYLAVRMLAPEAEILKIVIAPAEQGRGFGHRLLAHGLSSIRARGGVDVHLEVRPSNQSARALYEHLGFLDVGLRPAYYADGTDALRMRLELPAEPPDGGDGG